MRRFYGYLILVVSLILVIFANVQTQIQGIASSIEYSGGYETLYKIDSDSKLSVDEIADIVVKRIEDADVDNAIVQAESGEKSGSDEDYIRIQMSGDTLADIDYVLRSVESTGHITVSTLMDDANYAELDNPFEIGSAKVNWNQSTPYVEVGVKNVKEFITFLDNCKSDYAAFNEIYNKDSSDSSNIDGVMVIWLDKEDDDSYIEAYTNPNEVTKEKIRDRVLAIVPTNNFYYTENVNGDYEDVKLLISYYDFEQISMNAKSAHTIERVINYGSADFAMTRLYTQRIDPTAASINGYDKIILWGVFASLVVLLCYLVVRYGLAGLSGWTGILVSVFTQIALFNYFKFVFSTIAAIGLVASVVLNAAAVIVYLEKFKNELYKGRSAVKANQEANKNTLINVIDATAFGLLITIVGIFAFSSQINSLPVILCLGVSCSLIFNRLTLLFTMWWLTNNKLAQTKLSIFGVKQKDVPDIMKMETQRKFAPLHNVDPKKHGKRASIVAAVTSGVCALVLVVFAIIPGLNVFNTSSDSKSYSRAEIATELVQSHYLFETKENAMKFFEEKYPEYKVTNVEINVVENVVTDGSNVENLKNIAYVSVTFDSVIEDDELHVQLLENLKNEDHVDPEEISVNIVTCSAKSVNYLFKSAIVAVSIVAALAIGFILLRFGYTQALASLATVIPTALVSIGFFSATRLEISALSLVGIAAGIFIVVLAQIPLYERMKKMKRDSKVKITSFEQKEEITIASFKESIFATISIDAIALAVIIIVACFSPLTSSVLSTYGTMAIAVVVGALFTLFLLIPVYLFLEKRIGFTFHINRAKRNKKAMEKAKKENRNAGAEPEESKIPGINC